MEFIRVTLKVRFSSGLSVPYVIIHFSFSSMETFLPDWGTKRALLLQQREQFYQIKYEPAAIPPLATLN